MIALLVFILFVAGAFVFLACGGIKRTNTRSVIITSSVLENLSPSDKEKLARREEILVRDDNTGNAFSISIGKIEKDGTPQLDIVLIPLKDYVEEQMRELNHLNAQCTNDEDDSIIDMQFD